MEFNPNATGTHNSGLFALPYHEEEASLVFLPVPWEVTTSYGHGCSLGPDGIFLASKQLDLCDALYGEFYKMGLHQKPTSQDWLNRSRLLKEKAMDLREKLEKGESFETEDIEAQAEINQASIDLNEWLYEESKKLIDKNKWVAAIGGDHSAPFGLIKALSEKYKNLSILHIDAHMDLRKSYQGYFYSHASIMYNVVNELRPRSLVQLGIRDFCPQEKQMEAETPEIHTFFDSSVNLDLAQGKSWDDILNEVFFHLTDEVYISFDIDGLQPDLCPNTGTPVPGGLSFQQVETMLYKLSQSEKKIVGFDLCEVSPESEYDLEGWDSNVGARILFKMAGALLTNHR